MDCRDGGLQATLYATDNRLFYVCRGSRIGRRAGLVYGTMKLRLPRWFVKAAPVWICSSEHAYRHLDKDALLVLGVRGSQGRVPRKRPSKDAMRALNRSRGQHDVAAGSGQVRFSGAAHDRRSETSNCLAYERRSDIHLPYCADLRPQHERPGSHLAFFEQVGDAYPKQAPRCSRLRTVLVVEAR
jgi:hypothetical protein